MTTLSVRTIAANCGLFPPLLVKEDILGHDYFRTNSLKEKLIWMQKQCGAWEILPKDSRILAIHAAVLSTNEILYFGGDEHSRDQHNANDIDHTRLFDVSTGEITPISSPTTDVFCAGHAFLGDGRLLVGGGTEEWGVGEGDPGHGAHPHALNFGGHRECWVYNPPERNWTQITDMNFQPGRDTGGGRWYPTLITLPNGEVLAFFGHPSRTDTRHRNSTPERYSPASNSWTLLPAIAEDIPPPDVGPELNYPRLHVLPNGQIFFATPVNGNRFYNPATGVFVGPTITPPPDPIYQGWFVTSVLLPLLPGDSYTPRVLLCGGSQPYRINLGESSPTWRVAGTRTGTAADRIRENLCAVILPTGDVFLSGGVEDSGSDLSDLTAVREGEIYSPGIDWDRGVYISAEIWVSTQEATVVRNYHSVALLMPNGRVWTAGSSKNANQGDPDDPTIAEKRIEVYKPSYDADPNRPEITASPVSIIYGQSFEIQASSAASIQRIALIRAGSVTHAFDADQRYVGVAFNHVGGNRLVATAPPDGGVAPPGYYMLWLIDDAGRPCKLAKFIRVSVSFEV